MDEFGFDDDDLLGGFDMDAAIAAAAPPQVAAKPSVLSPAGGGGPSPAASPSSSPVLPAQAGLVATLDRHFGYKQFRDGQLPVIEAALEQRDTAVFWAGLDEGLLSFSLPILGSIGNPF
jgi:hypothetical protein